MVVMMITPKVNQAHRLGVSAKLHCKAWRAMLHAAVFATYSKPGEAFCQNSKQPCRPFYSAVRMPFVLVPCLQTYQDLTI
jgi:hypothetical protein